MPRLIWSPFTLADIQWLYGFLAKKDKDTARRAIKTIRAGVKMLARQPEAGRPVDEMDPAFREWLIDFGSSGYIAMYRIEGETATIFAVRHQKEAGY
ncbi:RelE/ParE family toxin [Photorhabdus luminescens]|uniref:Plasmid stabilization protein n=1 Tax=Photorhabdus akhurstii TaxID=171438 RepID=A0ABX8LWQ0_9GAMM|nr:type II toxin-antitoxin system RelE/ParE family toxin [Photorhabdus akhurstii]QXF33754.1 plasmid stabilization protein [Photorhabdus akhurstii]UJD75569.1 RelE/ParE family toxin [Photorhabdus luminescens]